MCVGLERPKRSGEISLSMRHQGETGEEKTAGALGVPGRGEVRDHSPSTASLRAPRWEHSSEFGHSEDGRTGAEEPGEVGGVKARQARGGPEIARSLEAAGLALAFFPNGMKGHWKVWGR